MPIFDLICPWCGAQQKIPAHGVPFRFYCGNCHDLLTYRGEENYRACYDEIQEIKRRNPRWRELDVPVLNRNGNSESPRLPPFIPYEDRRRPF